MFRIKSDDQRAKALKRIERFTRDVERLRTERGPAAAAAFRRLYGPHAAQFMEQVERYDSLRRHGARSPQGQDISNLGSYLVDARVASGLTQVELAKRLGVSQPMVYKYENACYEGCSLRVIERALEALGLEARLDVRRRRPPHGEKGDISPRGPAGGLRT